MKSEEEKLRDKGLDEQSIKIWMDIKENTRKRENCPLHEFERTEKPYKYKCNHCGCIEDGGFLLAYQQGLEHGRAGGGAVKNVFIDIATPLA